MGRVGNPEGVIPAIITPCDEAGGIRFDYLEKQACYLAAEGVHGLFVAGTTGEGAHLSTTEKMEVYQCVRDAVGERLLLCLACIQPSTQTVLAEIELLGKLAPDYLVSVTPYYYQMDQQDLIEHFKAVARCSPAPVILYNIPLSLIHI